MEQQLSMPYNTFSTHFQRKQGITHAHFMVQVETQEKKKWEQVQVESNEMQGSKGAINLNIEWMNSFMIVGGTCSGASGQGCYCFIVSMYSMFTSLLCASLLCAVLPRVVRKHDGHAT
jgi:CO dehydrogenase nickel-insertion accessory protein CooC1